VTVRPQSHRVWVFAILLLAIGTAVSAILASVTLDALMQRPSGGGSMTTMLPGAVYAMASVMKACLVTALIAAATWIATAIVGRSGTEAAPHRLPSWGLAAIALVVSTPLIGAIGAVIAQSFIAAAPVLSLDDLPDVSRAAVLVQLTVLVTGALSAGVSLAEHERPRLVAALGLAAALVLIGLFWHFQFYARGFDQDTWAPR